MVAQRVTEKLPARADQARLRPDHHRDQAGQRGAVLLRRGPPPAVPAEEPLRLPLPLGDRGPRSPAETFATGSPAARRGPSRLLTCPWGTLTRMSDADPARRPAHPQPGESAEPTEAVDSDERRLEPPQPVEGAGASADERSGSSASDGRRPATPWIIGVAVVLVLAAGRRRRHRRPDHVQEGQAHDRHLLHRRRDEARHREGGRSSSSSSTPPSSSSRPRSRTSPT